MSIALQGNFIANGKTTSRTLPGICVVGISFYAPRSPYLQLDLMSFNSHQQFMNRFSRIFVQISVNFSINYFASPFSTTYLPLWLGNDMLISELFDDAIKTTGKLLIKTISYKSRFGLNLLNIRTIKSKTKIKTKNKSN